MTTRKSALAAAALLIASTAQADFSANLGWASDYYFRGILQKTSSPSAGIDYESENGSFYAGTWAADVAGPFGDGLEVDGYFGYNGSIGEFGYGVGYTGYFYTGDFDDTYQEINLSVAYGWLSLEAAIGEYENFAGPTQEYQFYKATVSHNGFYGAYGTFQDEFDGDYFEVGYGTTVSDIDLGIYLLVSDEKLGLGDDQEALVFTIGKTFDLN